MTVVLDTSVLLALLNRRDPAHPAVASWWAETRPLVRTTPLVLAEADHLLVARSGRAGARALTALIDGGALGDRWWDGAARRSAEVAARHEDMGLGLTDSSLVALAEHEGSHRVATLDERHFRAVRPLTGEPAFVLLPTDR